MKLLPLFLFFSLNLVAQQKTAAPKMPDIEAMKRLSTGAIRSIQTTDAKTGKRTGKSS